jgi:hypothetical protein
MPGAAPVSEVADLGLGFGGAMWERSRKGGPPTPPRPPALSVADADQPGRRPPGGRPSGAGSTVSGLLRIVCWGVIAIGVTIALALAMRESPGADDYGAVEPLHFLALAFAKFARASPSLPGLFLYLAIVGIPATLLHELGHAVIARRRLGGEVRISVGTAGKLANVRLGQITMSINALGHPGRRAGHASFAASRASARDVVLIALAGPAASLVGCVLTAWALSSSQTSGVWHDLMWAATAAGAFGVLNIVPFKFQERRDGPRLRSDGLVALRAARVARSLR